MSEQEMVKVYELAKELGIDSISLLDKLKSLNIKVKNHMSELKTEEVQFARSSLRRGSSAEKSAKKVQTKTRKKAGEGSSAAAAATDAGSTEKRAPAAIIRRRGRPDQTGHQTSVQVQTVARTAEKADIGEFSDESQLAASSVSETVHEGTSALTENLSVETETSSALEVAQIANPETSSQEDLAPVAGAAIEPQAKTPANQPHLSSPSSSQTDQLDKQVQQTPKKPFLTTTTKISVSGTSGTATAPSSERDIKGDQKTVSSTASSQTSAERKTIITKTTGGTSTSASAQAPAGQSATGTKQESVVARPVAPRPPIVFTPRPVAPRRSILKIVEATPPPPRPIIKPAPSPQTAKAPMKGTATQDKDGFRIIKMTKENLDQMIEEEAAKKRGGGREAEIRPEDVRFADYRKKELVFLPKKKKIPVGKEIRQTQKTVAKAQKRYVEMAESISVQDLANQLSVKAPDVIRKLIGMGQMATINQSLDFDTATLVANDYQYEVRNIAFKEHDFFGVTEDEPGQLQPRPPVVTIMGHVDHGKTTLLDSIREANVAAGEAGGITQHMGAYTVEKNGKLITFIDTPGHEAFTVMRARGANVTDIVILVVAADDGVMPQTREAISHAQAAKVPIIVAVNKIDKPGANPEKIKQGLAELNLLAEDWGGDTMFIPVSALKKTHLDKLLDSVLLQAEMLDLKANPDALAKGTVLEARLEKGRGPVMSVLVARGSLKVGDALVAGPYAGKVKALTDDKGRTVKSATPGTAVEVLGLEGVPNAGEPFNAIESETDARKIAENRVDASRTPSVSGKVSLEDLFAKIQAGDVKELNAVLKADAYGSVEAIRDSLIKLSTDKVKVKPILAAAGGISESDVLLASASNAIIIGFNVRPETKARQLAEAEHVEIKCYNIIYELLDDIKKAMVGLLDKKKVEKFLGRAEVRQTFSVPKIGMIAGASVIDGKVLRNANVRLLRDSRVIFEGKMSSLKRFKDDVKEVATGFECGIGIENYNDLKPGDIIEAFQIELVTPDL